MIYITNVNDLVIVWTGNKIYFNSYDGFVWFVIWVAYNVNLYIINNTLQ